MIGGLLDCDRPEERNCGHSPVRRMQHRYTADLGDFGKYGLLRALCSSGTENGPTLSLGVIWYLIPDEGHNADGKHVRYLSSTPFNEKTFRKCDPELYDHLSAIIQGTNRNVVEIRTRGLPIPDTTFYEDTLNYKAVPLGDRRAHRAEWATRARLAVAEKDIVFADPDNGFEVSSCASHHASGGKYAFFAELREIINRNQSLVVYHHLNRRRSAAKEIRARFEDIRKEFGRDQDVFALHYHRGTARVFFVVPAPETATLLRRRAEDRIVRGPWGQHFDLLDLRSPL